MADSYQGKIRFLKVDITKHSELASSYNVFSVPTLMVFDTQGKMVENATGLEGIEKVLKKLDKIAAK